MCKSKVAYLMLLIKIISISQVLTHPVNTNKNNFLKNDLSEENQTSDDLNYDYDKIKRVIFDKYIEKLLEEYYDKFVDPKPHEHFETKSNYFLNDDNEQMQGDMPSDGTVVKIDDSLKLILSNKTGMNLTDLFANATHPSNGNGSTSQRFEEIQKEREKSKIEWLDHLRSKVLQKTGRKNNTSGGTLSPGVLEQFRKSLNSTGSGLSLSNGRYPHHYDHINGDPDEGEYIEKIRSFYPSCDMPRNTDEEAWKDANTMNLFFNVDYTDSNTESNGDQQQNPDVVNIASATLRLYRLPQETNISMGENCQKTEASHVNNDDDKQIRVSVYWYSRSLKKHKAIKRRLADSRMVPTFERLGGTQYVEFNIRSATKSWVKGRNLGLGVVVEDIDGAVLPTDKYFKGIIGCDTVGNFSTPKPIPTVVLDALRDTNATANRLGNSTVNFGADADAHYSLMPKLDICTIELPQNLSLQGQSTIDTSTILCRMLKSNDAVWRKFTSTTTTNGRHIRHQHHTNADSDMRSKFVSKRLVLTNEQLNHLSRQLQTQGAGHVNR